MMKILKLSIIVAVTLLVTLTSAERDEDCPFHRVYTECGSACKPRTCVNKDEAMTCLHVCIPGCYCPDELYATEDGKCVKEEECPLTCTNGMVYTTCGSLCPTTCDDIDDPPVCPHVCVSGCFCPSDMVANGNTCVQREECSSGPSCTVNGVEHSDGESFPSVDGHNTCTCENGTVDCTEETHFLNYPNVIQRCRVGDIVVFEKQPYNDGCTECTCHRETINCTVSTARCADPMFKSFDVSMTFSGDYDAVVTDVDSFKNSVKNSLISRYGSTYNLKKSQISDVKVSRGSIVVMVTLEDSKELEQSANVTILLMQMEQDYLSSSLTITYNGTTLQPATEFSYSDNGGGNGGNHKSYDWVAYPVVAVVVVLLIIIIVTVIVVVFYKKRQYKSLPSPSKNDYLVEFDAKKGLIDQ